MVCGEQEDLSRNRVRELEDLSRNRVRDQEGNLNDLFSLFSILFYFFRFSENKDIISINTKINKKDNYPVRKQKVCAYYPLKQ